MKILLRASAAIALLAVAGSAHAQSADWTGAYVGAFAGYGAQTDAGSDTVLFDNNLDGGFGDVVRTAAGADAFSPGFCRGTTRTPTPGNCSKADDSGADYGVRAGYDWAFDQAVIGVVAEYSQAEIKDSVTAFSTTPASYTFTRELDSLAALRVRGGGAYGENLFYLTAGVARGKINRSFTTSNGVNTFTRRGDDDANGYQIGGGYERRFGKFTLGAEYLYTSLNDDQYTVRASGPAPATNPFILTNASGTDFRRGQDQFKVNSFRVTMGYRF